MKIAIIGYSGSGKSTLARKLSDFYNVPILHLDTVEFLPNWGSRNLEEKLQIVGDFLKTNSSWVIDGNYGKLYYWERMEQADTIVILRFGRFQSLCRVFNRYRKYKGGSRPDMAVGCNEKLDFDFVKWILWGGRSKVLRLRYEEVISRYPNKVFQIENQKELDRFISNLLH